jgi:hypothetical protein
MARTTRVGDFRATRVLLPDEVFAFSTGPTPDPTDLVSASVWHDLMGLPDDVAIRTSDHHGLQLADLDLLYGDWLKALGEVRDELLTCMLNAEACFQASTFDMLHGYYRSALSDLRTAMELVAIGTLGNLKPADLDYHRWQRQNIGSLPLSSSIKKLRRATEPSVAELVFKPNGWMDKFYQELCAYAHCRPDASDGEMWASNGPVYDTRAFNKVFKLQLSTYGACYVLVKIGRPGFVVEKSSDFLFTTPTLVAYDEIAVSYRALP